MNIPGFTADASLYKAGRFYRAIETGQSNQLRDSVRLSASHIPTRRGCWCTEPDTREVCNETTGVCVEKPICLQWWCGFPSGGELPDVPVVIVRTP